MSDVVEKRTLKHGLTAYILNDDMCSENPITDWDNVAEINIWSSRHLSYTQSEFFDEDHIPDPYEIYEAVECALDEVGGKASGEVFAKAMGYDNVITWDLYAEDRDDGNQLSATGYRQLSRAVNWLKKKYWWGVISKYEHGNVRYFAGHPTDRWDSGYCGVAVVDREKHKVDLRTPCKDGSVDPDHRAYEYASSLLRNYTDWCNGEVYGWRIVDENDEEVDSCWGYIGLEWCEEALAEQAAYYEEQWEKGALYPEIGSMITADMIKAKCDERFIDRESGHEVPVWELESSQRNGKHEVLTISARGKDSHWAIFEAYQLTNEVYFITDYEQGFMAFADHGVDYKRKVAEKFFQAKMKFGLFDDVESLIDIKG